MRGGSAGRQAAPLAGAWLAHSELPGDSDLQDGGGEKWRTGGGGGGGNGAKGRGVYMYRAHYSMTLWAYSHSETSRLCCIHCEAEQARTVLRAVAH